MQTGNLGLNETVRVIVVDDEFIARKGLIKMLESRPGVEVVGEAKDVDSWLKLVDKEKPEAMFLDIRMREDNVMNYIEDFEHLPQVVFTTAYPEYAYQSYRFDTLDYLLKPITPDSLDRAVNRIVQTAKKKKQPAQYLYIKSDRMFLRILYDDILFAQGMENYISIQTIQKKIVIKKTMKSFEELLPENFMRVHKSYIVNKDKIEVIERLSIQVADTKIPVSRDNKSKVYYELLGRYED